MITVTPIAAEKLSAYLSENNVESPIRITVMNGCGGQSLGLALDKSKENDHVCEQGKIILLIARDLSEECGKVSVDFVEKTSGCGGGGGFTLTSEKPLPAGGGCGSSCSTSGCGC